MHLIEPLIRGRLRYPRFDHMLDEQELIPAELAWCVVVVSKIR
jgi:hypothetical protein